MENEKYIIEELINSENYSASLDAIAAYEKEHPYDADILSFYTVVYLQSGHPATALEYALKGVRSLPLNAEMQYNLAVVYESLDMYYEAYQAYTKADHIFSYTKDERRNALNPSLRAKDLLQRMADESESNALTNRKLSDTIYHQINMLYSRATNLFGLSESSFRSYIPDMIGTWYYDTSYSKRYVGVFRDQYFNRPDTCECRDLIHTKAEFLEATEGTEFNLENLCSEYLLPIASAEPNYHTFKSDSKDYLVFQNNPYRFTYYRLPGNTTVLSQNKCIYGNPIPIKSDPLKKKLVMSIFVDGLSYYILKDDNFKKNMPYTFEFFRHGTIFTNAFNSAEWTYPSIASFVTGLDTTHHMLFHDKLDYPMPENIPTIAEYFHNDGYYTSNYGGNWRIIPSYGHSRGYDRFVYQHALSGFKVYDVIADTINQLEAGNELNQYIWISIGDLHDIADKYELPVCVQKDIPITNRTYHESGPTSVKQKYSFDDTNAYLKTAGFVDKWLHILFKYIEENYSDDEIVISLFSDHGQGYLFSGENSHFLSAPRSNIPIMFRGSISDGIGYCDETISALDYGYALRRIAGIQCDEVPTDGQLPHIFGGSTPRKYAYTESIHPGDPYQAAIFSPDNGMTFFFTNKSIVFDDGRFMLDDYDAYLLSDNGDTINDSEKYQYYLSIVLDHIAPLLIYI